MKKFILPIAGILLFAIPLLASAQITGVTPLTGGTSTIHRVIQTIITVMLGILVVISVAFILFAAFLYLTSAGDPIKVAKARNYIIYAVVALVIGFLSRALVVFVLERIGAQGTP